MSLVDNYLNKKFNSKWKVNKIIDKFLFFTLELFKRKSLFQLNFTSGTTTWQECLMVLCSLLKLEPLQDGKWIGAFEKELSNLLGVRYVFTFSAGRMALYAILKALGIQKDEEIILPGYTCVVVPAAIIYAGGKPVYVDISKEDYNIDVSKVEEKITNKTRAIIAQHTYGSPCNLGALREICNRYNLILIEDCAHTLGTFYEGRKLGAIGDVAFFSTDHTKFISTSVGGIAATDNELIEEKLRINYEATPFLSKKDILKILLQFIVVNVLLHPRVSFFGRRIFDLYSLLGLTFFMSNYHEIKKPDSYPYPARMSNIQAKIGLSQLKNLQQNIHHRKEIFLKFCDIFRGVKIKNTSEAPLRFVLEVNNRDEWIKTLSPIVNIETWFDSCAHGKKENLWEIGYKEGECPVAEEVTERIINFPTHLKVRTGDVEKIALKLDDKLLKGIVNGGLVD